MKPDEGVPKLPDASTWGSSPAVDGASGNLPDAAPREASLASDVGIAKVRTGTPRGEISEGKGAAVPRGTDASRIVKPICNKLLAPNRHASG